LSAGVLLLAYQTNDFTLSGIITKVGDFAVSHTLIAGVCIITATIIQSAIYPSTVGYSQLQSTPARL
jgi:NAD(P)H-quinone oxidoreductase subunit 5